MSTLVFFKHHEVVAVKHKSGEETKVYGYPVTLNGETVGIVVPGRLNKSYQAYKLEHGVVASAYSYKTRKEAFASFMETV